MTDVGVAGINAFFANHVCNEYCNKNWLNPKVIQKNLELPKKESSTYKFDETVKN